MIYTQEYVHYIVYAYIKLHNRRNKFLTNMHKRKTKRLVNNIILRHNETLFIVFTQNSRYV